MNSPPSETDLALLEAAREVAARAYAPASGFQVGAAVASADGRVFAGCNVENASYGLTLCAERSAVVQAIAAGARELVACAIYTDVAEGTPPCGACRQVLAEFGPTMRVLISNRTGLLRETDLGALLPDAFRF